MGFEPITLPWKGSDLTCLSIASFSLSSRIPTYNPDIRSVMLFAIELLREIQLSLEDSNL